MAGDYLAFRPHYPDALYQWLASLTPGHDQAWDAGTGNGQAAVALAAHYSRVVATDFSIGQIENAIPHPRVEYRVAGAEESGLEPGSTDLVTVAQALHWFDAAAFFREVQRVLVPSGAVVAWTYGVVHVDEARADEVLGRFYYQEIGPWWPDNRRLVEEGYRSIEFPFTPVAVPSLELEARWTLGQLTGYIGTWSAVSRYQSDRGEDPIPDLARRLAETWGNPLEHRKIRWPLRILAGRNSEGVRRGE